VRSLRRAGVSLGPEGFQVVDLHSNKELLSLKYQQVIYKGGVDAAVVPYGVGKDSVGLVLRVSWEHKQSGKAKIAYAIEKDLTIKVRCCYCLVMLLHLTCCCR
jgi:hypothetical protein